MRKQDASRPSDGQADLFGPAIAARKPSRTPARTKSVTIAPKAQAKTSAGLLNVREAAFRLGLSKSTLDKLRCKGEGPRFIKSTERAVRYDPVDLDAWIEARRRQSTAKSE